MTETKPACTGRKNAYHCQACAGRIVTVDVHEGVTPFMVICKATPGCRGLMHSAFYRIPQDEHATWEWYKPTIRYAKTIGAGTVDHVKRGGLLLRRKGEEH